jgi:hypothetical protein
VYTGAPLVTAPKIVSVTFPGDTMTARLDTFGSGVTSSSYWNTVTTGYCGGGTTCIGDGTGSSVQVSQAPASSYADSTQGSSALQTYLSGLIAAFPAAQQPDSNTIYTFYFPSTTTITLDGATSCQDFGGYHNALTMGNQPVIYAIVPECPVQGGPATALEQETTLAASHEIAEAASDGIQTETTGGYYLDFNNPATWGWNDVGGGEIGDLCVDFMGLGGDATTENGFTVQRIWSILQASAGKNPCVPIPAGEVYFNAFSNYSVVVIDVGQSTTIQVDALADGAMSSGWQVTAVDVTDPSGQTKYLSFTIAGGTKDDAGNATKQVQSGDSLQLTVTMVQDPGQSQTEEGDAILLSTDGDPSTATKDHYWPFIVMTTAEAQDNGVSMMKHHPRRSRVSDLARLVRASTARR